MTENNHICVFAGLNLATNVYLDTLNLGWMIRDEYHIDLLTAKDSNQNGSQIYFDLKTCDKGSKNPSSIPVKASVEWKCISQYLNENSPEIILQTTQPTRTGLVLSAAAKRFNIPFVYRYSGDSFAAYAVADGWRKAGYFAHHNILGRLPLKFATRHIVFGPRGNQRLLERGVSEDNIAVLPPAIDVTKFESRTPPPNEDAKAVFNEDRFSILYVGPPKRRKGFHFLVSHVPDVASIVDDVEFVFVGVEEADNSKSIDDEYADLIRFVGRVPPEQMPYYFQRANLLVQPSYLEGLPRIILESLASGTPVVARDVGEVSAVTDNTFTTSEEFLRHIQNYDDLPVDSVAEYDRRTLAPRYKTFFDEICRNYSAD